MTTLIPDSWELPSYLAGDLLHMDKYRREREREVIPDADEDGEWEQPRDAEVIVHPKWRIRRGPSTPSEPPAPSAGWEIEPYDPAKHGPQEPGDLMSVDSQQALEREGFENHEPGVWQRRVHHENGNPTGLHHIITYEPGNRRPSTHERAPWVLTTDPDTVGTAFRSVEHALSAANADRDQVRKMSRLGSFMTALNRLIRKEAVEKTPAQLAAERWLEDHSEDFETWHPSESDYTYRDFGDAAGQSFHGDEAQSHVLPGSHYHPDADWETGLRHQPSTWTTDGQQQGTRISDRFGEGYYDDDPDLQPEHERHLEDLGFNWEHRGDPNTTPVGVYQEGQYVRHQHTPEGEHIATHTIYREPSTNQWHVERSPADLSGFVEEHSQHQWPHDAISRYHTNAEQALLPGRGYEPHRGRSGVITHWTRTDTDPSSGQTYEHEIVNQPPHDGGYQQGWLGQTHADHMTSPVFAPNGTHNQRVQSDLADVVREQESIGRGLHPGGSQDHRLTRAELLSDPTVARLGTPRRVSDSFYGDGRVGSASWSFPHPEGSPHPINAEATYNWEKGGYDFKYTHDGQWLAASHNHVPDGAPIHVPGRQLRLPLESAR